MNANNKEIRELVGAKRKSGESNGWRDLRNSFDIREISGSQDRLKCIKIDTWSAHLIKLLH